MNFNLPLMVVPSPPSCVLLSSIIPSFSYSSTCLLLRPLSDSLCTLGGNDYRKMRTDLNMTQVGWPQRVASASSVMRV